MWHYMALCHYIIMSFLVQLPEGWLSESNKASFILPTFLTYVISILLAVWTFIVIYWFLDYA